MSEVSEVSEVSEESDLLGVLGVLSELNLCFSALHQQSPQRFGGDRDSGKICAEIHSSVLQLARFVDHS